MTALTLQLLCIRDCERAIERNYYDWGRGRAADSPEPDWDTAAPAQRRQVAIRGYELYDGVPPQYGNRIGPLEVYASAGINSHVVLLDAVRFLLRAEEAEPLLARIPDNALLETGTDDQIAAAGELIDAFDDAHQVGRGKATKVLYLKRRGFIPIIGSVVSDIIRKNFPFLLRQTSATVLVLQVYRLLLQTEAADLGSIRANLAERGFRLTAARLRTYLTWIGWRDHVGRSLQTEWQAASPAGDLVKAFPRPTQSYRLAGLGGSAGGRPRRGAPVGAIAHLRASARPTTRVGPMDFLLPPVLAAEAGRTRGAPGSHAGRCRAPGGRTR